MRWIPLVLALLLALTAMFRLAYQACHPAPPTWFCRP